MATQGSPADSLLNGNQGILLLVKNKSDSPSRATVSVHIQYAGWTQKHNTCQCPERTRQYLN
jgi:hypothetical protein